MGDLVSATEHPGGAPTRTPPPGAGWRAGAWRAVRRGALRRRARRRPHAAVCLATFLCAPFVLAFAPADVLTSTPDSERSLRQAAAVADAERALGVSRAGTDVTFTARPALSYGADVEDPAALGARADLELDLAWRYDNAAILADRADLLLARERLRHARRSDVLAALRLQAKALRAEVAVQRAELDLARERLHATTRAAPSNATRSNATRSSPSLLRTEALVDGRRHALQALRTQAARLGFAGAAQFVPLRFAMPPPAATAPQRERLRLELERATAERDRVPFDVLRDVTLSATYESSSVGYQVSTSLSLDRGRPAADLNGQLGPQADDQWSIELRARLRLDGGADSARSSAVERVRRARAALDALDASFAADVARARTAVDDASALLEAELAAWRDTAATPATSPSACRALLARENAVYGAWLDVIGATYDYLESVDGSWGAAASAPDTKSAASATPAATPTSAPTSARTPAPTPAPGLAWPVRPSTCADRVG